MKWVSEWLLDYNLIDQKDLDYIYVVKNIDQVLTILNEFKLNRMSETYNLYSFINKEKNLKESNQFKTYIEYINEVIIKFNDTNRDKSKDKF